MFFENAFHFHNLPAPSGKTKGMIVILHGYGSHPDKFVKWGQKMQTQMPDVDVLVVRGPLGTQATPEQKAAHNWKGEDDLYAWRISRGPRFGRLRNMLAVIFNRFAVAHDLNAFIDAQLQKRGLEDKNLALVGFSQGGMLAVLAGVRRQRPCAAVVCHSGFVYPGTWTRSKPDTLLIMGKKDEFFFPPPGQVKKENFLQRVFKMNTDHAHSAARLRNSGIAVTEKFFDNQTHRVTLDSWVAATDFIAKRLKP